MEPSDLHKPISLLRCRFKYGRVKFYCGIAIYDSGNPQLQTVSKIFLFFSSLMSSSLKHVRNPVVDRLMGKESAGLVPSNLRNDSYYMATHQVRFIEYSTAEFLVIKRASLIYCRKRKLSSNYYKFCRKNRIILSLLALVSRCGT